MKKIQLTNAHKEKLFQIPLFRDLPLNIKESLLDKLDFVIYAADKKEIVVTHGRQHENQQPLAHGDNGRGKQRRAAFQFSKRNEDEKYRQRRMGKKYRKIERIAERIFTV